MTEVTTYYTTFLPIVKCKNLISDNVIKITRVSVCGITEKTTFFPRW